MEIKRTEKDIELVLGLVGRLDTNTAPLLEEAVSDLSNYKKLVLDFKELEYISSAGLRVLLLCQKQMNKLGEMEVINVNEDIKEIFDITGFCDILTIK